MLYLYFPQLLGQVYSVTIALLALEEHATLSFKPKFVKMIEIRLAQGTVFLQSHDIGVRIKDIPERELFVDVLTVQVIKVNGYENNIQVLNRSLKVPCVAGI